MINQLVKLNLKPEYSREFMDRAVEGIQQSIQESGNMEMKLFADKDSSDTYYIYSRWIDNAALENHKLQAYSQKFVEFFDVALSQPPQIMQLTETPGSRQSDINLSEATDSNVTLFVIFKIKTDMRELILRQFNDHTAKTQQEEGNFLFELYSVEGSQDTFVIYEHWENQAALDKHFTLPHFAQTGNVMAKAVIGNLEECMHFVKEIKSNNKKG